MKHLLIHLQLDESPMPLHIQARIVAIHHIFDQSAQQKILIVSNVDANDIFQKFAAPKPLPNKHLLLCFQPLHD